ncbi:uncharacterized protein LOC108835800 isoform X3 [Raphanus sativus]|uniref:Uncharacterized protein LOC108835800 isoform X3 n=1 Tax=Raphanus sativus TaxID=3726 RepID=A0A6J0LWF5_RAPSA|nr:uncharacterized protein LOC108835800 isoform X3 [Raphanus sativus]
MNLQRLFDFSGFNAVTDLLNFIDAHQTRHPHSMILNTVKGGVSPLINRPHCSSTVELRLPRFWDVKRGGDLMGVDMLLLDAQFVFRWFCGGPELDLIFLQSFR